MREKENSSAQMSRGVSDVPKRAIANWDAYLVRLGYDSY